MSTPTPEKRTLKKKIGGIRKRAAAVGSGGSLVRKGRLSDDAELPALWTPALDGVDLVSWAAEHREEIEETLNRAGAILFRGFGLTDPEAFQSFIESVSGDTLEYKERSTPRSQVQGNIYTSTDYPADQSIFPHNENSYQKVFPLRLCFCCHTAADEGGETPICDVRRVERRISDATKAKFREKGILYVRNFGDGMGLTWQSVFQTDDPQEVDAYCAAAGMETEWKAGGRLRIRRVLPATARHPRTGEELWFNHGTFFHVTSLAPHVRDTLLSTFAEEDLPNNTYYGDGTPISEAELEDLRAAYLAERVIFPWQVGDVLLLDNMLTAHAREPFRGSRKILTGMACPVSRDAA